MQNNIIDRLFASFEDLDKAITSAKKTLAARTEVPADIVRRLNSYDGILEKQRRLASELCDQINTGNWDEVTRLVTLINGLSAMIRDDARAILSALSLNTDPKQEEEEDLTIC